MQHHYCSTAQQCASIPDDVLAGLRVLALGEEEAEAALNLLQEAGVVYFSCTEVLASLPS